jgi:AcrR family transcriptional regulator
LRKTKEDSEKTRQLIIDAGIKIFSKNWYSSVKMEEIAKKAGLTRGAIYWHFKNKMELFLEIYRLVENEIISIVKESVIQGETLKEKIFYTLKNIIIKYYNDDKLKTMSKVIYLNHTILETKQFKKLDENYNLKRERFFYELFGKSVELGKSCNLNSHKTPIIRIISIMAYTQGLIDLIIFKKDNKLINLKDEDFSKLVNIFLDGFSNQIEGKKFSKKGEVKCK